MFEQVKKWLPFKRGEKHAKRVPAEINDPFARMDEDMRRLMAQFGFGGSMLPTGSDWTSSWFGDFSPTMFTPTLDVADKPERLEVTVELPGIESEDLDIDVHDGALVIRGHKRAEETSEEDGYYRTERSFGSFERRVPLPAEVDRQNTEASFENGVLTVKLPKSKPANAAKKVEIKTS